MEQTDLLHMKGIDKRFPGVHALKAVDFSVRRGEVHALMGENGAGKSTLIKILTGFYTRDAGEVYFDGQAIHPQSVLEAQKHGISTIYQELNLVPFQMVYENMFLGREPGRPGRIDRKKMKQEADRILRDMGICINVDTPLGSHSTAVQQMVAIARAISVQARLVVMDEPTSSLDTLEVGVLKSVIKKLTDAGLSVIFISHRLDEIYEICDRVTILKDGETVGCYQVEELDKLQLISLMIGRDASQIIKKKRACQEKICDKVMMSANNIKRGLRLNGVDVEIREGEILGFAGLLGSGRTEMAKILFGADIPDDGEIVYMDKRVRFTTPRDAIRRGIGFCSEDRKVEGNLPHLSVRENLTISLLPKISRFGIINRSRQKEVVDEYIKRISIKTPSQNQSMRNLSGGNQQKVLLSRWLCTNPRLVILDEPTRGIDVGAKSEIETLIQELSSQGINILIISSELEELERNCDRIIVMRDGRKIGELSGEDIKQSRIMSVIAQGHKEHMEEDYTCTVNEQV